LSFNDTQGTTAQFSNLEGLQPIFKSGQRIDPIIYTQTSSIGSNPSLSNLGGGYTGSIDFVQGDQAGITIDDFTLKAYSDGIGWSVAIQPNFPNVVNIGNGASFPSPYRTYTSSLDPQGPPIVTLNFEAVVYRAGAQNKGVTFQWYKNGTTPVGSPSVWDVATDPTFNINLSGISDAVNGNTFQLKINSIGPSPSTGIIDPGPLEITTDSYIQVTQSPSTNLGPVKRFWELSGSAPTNKIKARASSGGDSWFKRCIWSTSN
jgi:hypothetical protein